MSSIPTDDATLLAELLGVKWSADYETEQRQDALEAILEDRPDVATFLDSVRRRYWDTAESTGYEGPPSWRSHRTHAVIPRFEREFDTDALLADFEANYGGDPQ